MYLVSLATRGAFESTVVWNIFLARFAILIQCVTLYPTTLKDNRKRFLLRCCFTSADRAAKVSKKICAVGSLCAPVQSLKKTMNHLGKRPDVHSLLIFPILLYPEKRFPEIRCFMHNAVSVFFLLVYLALSWSWKNRSELEIHAERLEENDSCDDGMSLTLEEKLHKRPLTAVLHLLLLYCVLKFPDLFSTMPWTSSFLYATHCGKSLFLVSKFNFWYSPQNVHLKSLKNLRINL